MSCSHPNNWIFFFVAIRLTWDFSLMCVCHEPYCLDRVSALQSAGYEVFHVDNNNAQIELSACLMTNGTWVLTPQASFSTVCT